MTGLASIHRTLEQELLALLRGASLECPACGEFVLHDGPSVRCLECGFVLHGRADQVVVHLTSRSKAG